MKCQILFSGKNKKNIINLSSAENAQRVVKVNKSNRSFSFVSNRFSKTVILIVLFSVKLIISVENKLRNLSAFNLTLILSVASLGGSVGCAI